ncbi:MAG: D-alanine--D-alanine ligase [Candidatus Methylacidiphilales bacterium]
MNPPLHHITVLKGGFHSEREVSLRSGAGVAAALRSLGYTVHELDVVAPAFDLPKPTDAVFICLHGRFGEDGHLQQILEDRGLLYTGAGPASSRLAFDKLQAKARFTAAGIKTPRAEPWPAAGPWEPPYIVKPVADGSSVGVFRVFKQEDRIAAEQGAAQLKEDFMVEQMILGREFTVGILDDKALPVIEIRPEGGFYDYKHKYTPGMTQYLCPAPIALEVETELRRVALAAHRALGCEVYSRVDLMLDENNVPWVLEINTIPGMTETSLLPKAAAVAGLSYAALCERILQLSVEERTR